MRYAEVGVSLKDQEQFIELIKRLKGGSAEQIGRFAGLFDLASVLQEYEHPLLVSSTDGIGSKTQLAVAYGQLDGLGQALVAMNVNDLATLGARPLFFLDYYGTARLDLRQGEVFLKGLVQACERAGCTLIGGETAQLSDLYRSQSALELVGFVVGLVDQPKLPDPARLRPGDRLIGLPASGPHCNGYSLIRKIIAEQKLDLRKIYPQAGERPLGQLLLEPMPIYSKVALELFERFLVKGAAHITGSGIPGNLPRVLSGQVDALLEPRSWPGLKLFEALRRWGDIPDDEMWNVFNLGLGFIVILPPAQADEALRFLAQRGERAYLIGEIARGRGTARRV